jgi:hypothetical protein
MGSRTNSYSEQTHGTELFIRRDVYRRAERCESTKRNSYSKMGYTVNGRLIQIRRTCLRATL